LKSILYVSGGARSGKSRYAQECALELSDRPIYLATAKHWDTEFEARITRHQADRASNFETIECEKNLASISGLLEEGTYEGRLIVIDCVTLWLTNYFAGNQDEDDSTLERIKGDFDVFIRVPAHYIFISNEIGMGLHPESTLGRKFQDVHGWINQYIASAADKAIFMVSGIPLTVKG